MNQKAVDKMVAEQRLRKLSTPPFDQVDLLLAASRRNRLTYEGDVVIGRAEAEAAIEEAAKFRTDVGKIIDGLRPRAKT